MWRSSGKKSSWIKIEGKDKITKSERMIVKMKWQFIPIDYKLDLLKKMQGLKQAGKSTQEYMEVLYQVFIRTDHGKANKKEVSYYINRLRPIIQEELSLVWITSIEEAY